MVNVRETPVIIQCAVNGGEAGPNRHVPRTPRDVVRAAIEAARAGAAVIHLHAWDDGGPTQDPRACRAIMDAVREEEPEVIFNLTTTGTIGMPDDERLRPLEADPDVATIDCGTMNWAMRCLGHRRRSSRARSRRC